MNIMQRVSELVRPATFRCRECATVVARDAGFENRFCSEQCAADHQAAFPL